MDINKEIQAIIGAYAKVVKGIDKEANLSTTRAYGGIVRAGKGSLVESIAEQLVKIAWDVLGQDPKRLTIRKKQVKIYLDKKYLERIKEPTVRRYIQEHLEDYFYKIKVDRHIFIDNEFVLGIECKAYTENAMMKRILTDFTLLKREYPNIDCVLLQLESQLGGDYSSLNKVAYGSRTTHTLLSIFNIDLQIITLLKGERKVNQEIHKAKFYKPLEKNGVENAVKQFVDLLGKYTR